MAEEQKVVLVSNREEKLGHSKKWYISLGMEGHKDAAVAYTKKHSSWIYKCYPSTLTHTANPCSLARCLHYWLYVLCDIFQLVLPPWPMYRRNPLDWQKPRPEKADTKKEGGKKKQKWILDYILVELAL